MTAPVWQVFLHELQRLYVAAQGNGYLAQDIADAAQVDRHAMVKWLGGYDHPTTADERQRILAAVAPLADNETKTGAY